MSSIPATSEPFFTPGSRPTPTPDVDDTRGQRLRRGPVILATAVVLVIAGVVGIAVVRSQPATVPVAPDAPLVVNVHDLSAYAPGGSVYEQQVPSAPQVTDRSAYVPGGSVFGEQVPGTAQLNNSGGYAPGGSVYEQQVPGAAR